MINKVSNNKVKIIGLSLIFVIVFLIVTGLWQFVGIMSLGAITQVADYFHNLRNGPIQTQSGSTQDSDSSSNSDLEGVISLERTECFSACPSYKLVIWADGRVSYEGYNFVKAEGKQAGYITQDQLKELVNEFIAIDYFSLDEVYDTQITDVPSYTTSFTLNGKTKKVVDRHVGPEKLKKLENRIDEVTNSKQWIGK